MRGTRAALAIVVAGAAALLAVSGGSRSDPRTPAGLPGLPPPFLGTAVVGSGGRTAAIDSYGNVVDLRVQGPTSRAVIGIAPQRQAAGTVPAEDARVARARVAGGWVPFWRAEAVEQRYLPGTNVLVTSARFGRRVERIVHAAGGRGSARADRRWLARAEPLAADAPPWALRMYRRSLLVLRALTDRRTGAVAAGARQGWAYVWPRDAAAVAIALARSGYRPEARRTVRFLLALDLGSAARFDGAGEPVGGRDAQGDAGGWAAAAARAAGTPVSANRLASAAPAGWRDRADYQEKSPGDYLGNAIAAGGAAALLRAFVTPRGLVRVAGDPGTGLDSAAAWAVRPFSKPALFAAARRTLLRLAGAGGRYGITPSEDWHEADPWTAPTAWSAWSLAALAGLDGARATARPPGPARRRARAVARRERRAALRLMASLRRAATPLGMLPERVDARTGMPRSTTPLAWSHAFAVLAIRELWPSMLSPDACSRGRHR